MDNIKIYLNKQGEKVKQSVSHKALIFQNGKILLVKNEHTNELCVPGGRSQMNESIEETLIREIGEECQLKAVKLVNANSIHQNINLFRSPKDNLWRDIEQNWHLCKLKEIKTNNVIKQDKIIWANLNQAKSAFQRPHEKEVLQKISQYFS